MNAVLSPDSQFIQSVVNTLHYWQQRTTQLDDEAIGQLDQERQNLHRAVQYGLALSEIWQETAVVALQSFDLIERRGYWSDWTPVLVRAIQNCPEEHWRTRFKLLSRLGQLHRLKQQLTDAIATHLAARELAQQTGDKQTIAEAHHHLLVDYLQNRQYTEAEQYGLIALTLFQELDANEKWIADTFKVLGRVAWEQGNLAAAREWLFQAVATWRSLGQPTLLARALNDLANVLSEAGEYDQALTCLDEAAGLLAPTANELDKTMVQVCLGVLHFNEGKWAEAESAFRQANSTYLRQSGHVYYQAAIANNLGNVRLKQSRLADAESYLRQAADLWEQANDPLQRANTLGTLGETLVAQGQTVAALPFYEEAIALLERYPDNAWGQKLFAQFCQQYQAIKR